MKKSLYMYILKLTDIYLKVLISFVLDCLISFSFVYSEFWFKKKTLFRKSHDIRICTDWHNLMPLLGCWETFKEIPSLDILPRVCDLYDNHQLPRNSFVYNISHARLVSSSAMVITYFQMVPNGRINSQWLYYQEVKFMTGLLIDNNSSPSLTSQNANSQTIWPRALLEFNFIFLSLYFYCLIFNNAFGFYLDWTNIYIVIFV